MSVCFKSDMREELLAYDLGNARSSPSATIGEKIKIESFSSEDETNLGN